MASNTLASDLHRGHWTGGMLWRFLLAMVLGFIMMWNLAENETSQPDLWSHLYFQKNWVGLSHTSRKNCFPLQVVHWAKFICLVPCFFLSRAGILPHLIITIHSLYLFLKLKASMVSYAHVSSLLSTNMAVTAFSWGMNKSLWHQWFFSKDLW